MEELSQILGVPILYQIPFTGLEKEPRREEISSALHLQRYNIVANWETRSGVKNFLPKFLLEKAWLFWEDMDLKAFK